MEEGAANVSNLQEVPFTSALSLDAAGMTAQMMPPGSVVRGEEYQAGGG